jgi:hypothetical protein
MQINNKQQQTNKQTSKQTSHTIRTVPRPIRKITKNEQNGSQ